MGKAYSGGGKKRCSRRPLVRFFLLAKRLFLKPSFVALLLLIPVLGGLMALSSREDSGIVTVLVVAEGSEEELSRVIADDIIESESAINFERCESSEEALEEVRYEKADAAWILPAGLGETFRKYADDPELDVTIATVYQTRENPLQRVVREKLNGILFKYYAPLVLSSFSEESIEKAGIKYDKDRINRYFDEASLKVPLVKFDYTEGVRDDVEDEGYLTSPVRGLAYLAALLAALGSSLFCMRDENGGFFSRIPVGQRYVVIFESNFAASLISSAVVILTMVMTGSFIDLPTEILSALAFSFAAASFCTLLARLFSTPFALGAAIPPVVIATAILCPIFVTLRFPVRADLAFPVTYPLRAVRDPKYLLYALCFGVICMVIGASLDALRRRSS